MPVMQPSTDDAAKPPIEFDDAWLRTIASRAVRRDVDDAGTPAIRTIQYRVFNPVSLGVYDVTGVARIGGQQLPWRAVIKGCRPIGAEALAEMRVADPDSFIEMLRWDREANAYASGFLAHLRHGLEAPALLGIQRRPERIELWLEFVAEDEPQWDVERYRLAARHLGRFNGANLGQDAVRAEPWLSRNWIRMWAAQWSQSASGIVADDRIWSHPLIAELVVPTARAELRRLVDEHDRWWRAMEALPLGIAHVDPFRANLLSRRSERGDRTTVALDWAFVGYAPLAADLAQLVVGSLFYHGEGLDPDALASAAIAGYADGLRDVGYSIDERELARAYAINAVARWGLVIGWLPGVADPGRADAVTRDMPRLRMLAGRIRYLCSLATGTRPTL